jgi:hypothetical protein
MTEAQRIGLEKARLTRLENARREKEEKARLKQQEKELDTQMIERAKRGIEARKKMEELKKQMEELSKEASSAEDGGPQPEPVQKPEPKVEMKAEPKVEPKVEPEPKALEAEPEAEEEQEEAEQEEVKVVRRIVGKRRNGKKVILIDASIFEDDDEPVDIKRIGGRGKGMVEPRRRADRRTRFVDEPPMEEEYYDDDEDDYQPRRRPQVRNELTTMDNLNQSPHHHSNPAPPLAPIQRQAISREQLRQENPLFSMIFG